MNYTQNQKISQITPSTLVIGIDIANWMLGSIPFCKIFKDFQYIS